MAIKIKEKEFRLTKITLMDFKMIEMDRVLTNLFARIYHNGAESKLSRSSKDPNTVAKFLAQFLEDGDAFRGFNDKNHPEIVERWIETHLLDLVNRGKPRQAVAAPRPLHGFTYRFRNTKHCRDYGASAMIYELLAHARNNVGVEALKQLKQYFFKGVDPSTGQLSVDRSVDVEAQALLNSLNSEAVREDVPQKDSRNPHQPVCIGSADLLANDLIRLMRYKEVIPRTVMVDYLKILLAFHLGLYHLRLLKLLPRLIEKKGKEPICEWHRCPVKPAEKDPFGDCPHRIGLFLDVRGRPETWAAELAKRSADAHYRRIPGYIKAAFLARKLDEMGGFLQKTGKPPGGNRKSLSLREVLGLLGSEFKTDREQFFQTRIQNIVEDASGDDALDPELQAVFDLQLDPMETYIECLAVVRGDYHRKFITNFLDATLLKNRAGALVAQTRARGSPRRFVLDTRLLEVLLQLAVLEVRDGKLQTREIRVDDLLDFLRHRYGLHIDRLPTGDGFGEPSIRDSEALRSNREAFKEKLRDIGFFRDLSDAYITQNVSPRYRIQA
ncbi:MAG: hypothetical protein JJT96_17775 [Opitutales bacterium]|nr:hypothetical protein [Opitutales bacterium]